MKPSKVDAPLGVFDSGLGGLTVVRALREILPDEHIVYLGDTARVPYGTKGAATVIKYALSCARHLVARDVKALVIACNTVSAVAPERLRIELDVPVLGVVEPGAQAAVEATRTGRVGVLATAGTIASGGVSPRGCWTLDSHRGHWSGGTTCLRRNARRGLGRRGCAGANRTSIHRAPRGRRGRRGRSGVHALPIAPGGHRRASPSVDRRARCGRGQRTSDGDLRP